MTPLKRTHGCGFAVLAAMLLAPSTAAAATCSFNATAATVTVTIQADEVATVGRSAGGAITLDGVACLTATTANTNTVKVLAPATVTAQTAVLSLANGPLGPGKTAEGSGVSEIEVEVNLGPDNVNDQLVVSGSPAGDTFTLGSLGANLNPDVDTDVTWSGLDRPLDVRGLAGLDTISGAGGAGTGSPVSRPLVLSGGTERDTLTGGSGFDELWGEADNDTLRGGSSGDALHGQAGDDVLEGQAGNDSLYLDAGTDTMRGGDGGDGFVQEDFSGLADGPDLISGGRGADSLDLSARAHDVVIKLDNVANDGADLVAPVGAAEEGDNVQADVEDLFLGAGDDDVNADTQPANVAPAANFVDGGAGHDVLAGGDGDDQLFGDVGDDTLRGGFGIDVVEGREGADELFGGEDDDLLNAGPGADKTNGDGGDDYMAQESAPDGADVIAGGAGRDTVDFSLRSVHMRVILDNVVNDGADAARDGTAEEGDDVRADVEDVWTGGGSDYVNASTKPANAAGAENLLRGGANDDTLLGGHAEDHLEGGFGADTLTGGIGEDLLEGGQGADRFVAQDQYFDVIDGGFGDLDVDGVNSKDTYDSVINVP